MLSLSQLRLPVLSSLLLLLLAPAAHAGWMWDGDNSKIDDRIEAVHLNGIAAAFENNDTSRRRIIGLSPEGGALRYSVYVGYERQPGDSDLAALRNSGVSTRVWYVFQIIPYVQMELTFAEIQTVAKLPNVERVEAVEMMYAMNNIAVRTSGAKESRFRRFPTVQGNLALDGSGVVVSILDTGVNDQADDLTKFPGHEALAGKFIAGGNFYSGQPALNTPPSQSENPMDRGPDTPHGSHVAGTTLGTGGPTGVFGGVAPAAKLVDQKVLSDAGAGFGSAAGVEWAVLNKDKYGIRILNLSLGGLTASDGNDAGSRAINAAFDAGLIAVVASGNDSATGYMPSPAAADKAFTVGALADQNSIGRADDLVASFSNEGPRMSDGDSSFEDEMKPLVAAPGSGIVSSDGSLTTDGRQYTTASGTSMATPHVAGIVALVLQANPALTPAQVWEILKHTSEHRNDWGKTPAVANPFPGADPNYHPSGGWGQVDAYAAVKEALRIKGDPASQTQVVFINATPGADGASIDVTWKSQRETSLAGYDIWRAEDVSGGPGTFTKLTATPIAGIGSAVIERTVNRNIYTFRDSSGLTQNTTYWYRVSHTSNDPAVGTIHEPPIAVTLGKARAVARISYSITHNAMDNDLLTLIGTGSQAERARFVIDGKSALQADRVTTETDPAPPNTGTSTVGTLRHDFTIDLTSMDAVEAFLPPSKKNPWFLSVKEGGFVNRSGRVNSFSLTLFDSNGNPTATYSTGDLTPQETVEGVTTKLWIPDNPDVYEPGDAPSVVETEADSGAQGETEKKISIFGGELLPGGTVSFGDGITVHGVEVIPGTNVETDYQSGSQVVATISIDPNAKPGPRDVTVGNVDGAKGTGANVFTVTGDQCSLVVDDLDDADPAVEYGDRWFVRNDASASAGSHHWYIANGKRAHSAARIVFHGQQITVFYGTVRHGGSADVLIDGTLKGTVFYAGPTKDPVFGQSVTFDNLGDGAHELRLVPNSGSVNVDGFRIARFEYTTGADKSVVGLRTIAENATSQLTGLLNTVLVKTVNVSSADQSLAVNVEGSGSPVTVNIIDPAGTLVATGKALMDGESISGADTAVTRAGTYTVQVVDTLGQTARVNVSIARTVRVQ